MKKYIILMLVMTVGFTSVALGQNTASTNGVATANVIRAISIININNLNFGTLIWPPSGTGTATMSPLVSGFPTPQLSTCSGGVSTTLQGSSDAIHSYGPGPATFNCKGEENFTFVVTFPSPTIQITQDVGSQTLDVDNFTTNLPGNIGLLTMTLPNSTVANCYFMVGATVHIPVLNNSLTGWYDGNFPVTVAYN